MLYGECKVLFAISVTKIRLYQSIELRNFCWKQVLSLLLKIAASKAQSPVPGLGLPGFKLMPCFCALDIALDIIIYLSLSNNNAISELQLGFSGGGSGGGRLGGF